MDEYNQIKAGNNNFEKEKDREILEKDLTAYAIFGLQDPLRDSIKESIAKCKTAGIRTIMCTGDNIDTATAISINANIVTQEEIDASEESKKFACMVGKDFREYVGGLKDEKIGTKKVKDPITKLEKTEDVVIRVVARMDKFREVK